MRQKKTWEDWLQWGQSQLTDPQDAQRLLAHVLDVNRAWFFAHRHDEVDKHSVEKFQALVQRRATDEPLAYILGQGGFWCFNLKVTPATLIPRPETELLVEQALVRIPASKPACIADLGTGSGAIALALAYERPRVQVTATDVSVQALAIARENASIHGLERIRFLQSYWFDALTDQRFDVVVSNPPYIEQDDAHLEQNGLSYEPIQALASGKTGLDAITRITAQAPCYLTKGGWLLFEHGYNQGAQARHLLKEAGFEAIFTVRDLEERERVSGGRHS